MSGNDSREAYRALVESFDDVDNSLRTTITNAAVDINVSAFTDSIAIADASGNKVTTTTVGAKQSLDVNVTDITLDHANDSVKLGDGSNLITSTLVGSDRGLDVNVLNTITGTVDSAPVGLSNSGSFIELSIDSTSWTLVTVTDINRNHVWLQNQSDVNMKLNPSNAGGYTGIIIEPGQSVNIDIKQAIPLYLRAASGSGKIVGRMEFA